MASASTLRLDLVAALPLKLLVFGNYDGIVKGATNFVLRTCAVQALERRRGIDPRLTDLRWSYKLKQVAIQDALAWRGYLVC